MCNFVCKHTMSSKTKGKNHRNRNFGNELCYPHINRPCQDGDNHRRYDNPCNRSAAFWRRINALHILGATDTTQTLVRLAAAAQHERCRFAFDRSGVVDVFVLGDASSLSTALAAPSVARYPNVTAEGVFVSTVLWIEF